MHYFLLLIGEISKLKIENELLNALRENSKEKINCVFERIYNDYFKLGMFVAMQYLDESHSIDVVEDVFVNLFEKILKDRVFKIKNIKQYLCSSIKNASLKKIAESKSLVSFNEDVDYTCKKEISIEINNLFLDLNKDEIYIITEHAMMDKKFKVIATELNKPINTVTSIYRRGILKIKRRYHE